MTPELLTIWSSEPLIQALRSLSVSYVSVRKIDNPIDIWIRDWGPVGDCYFRYDPSYARGVYKSEAVARARTNLNSYLDFTPRELPLVLEGGNLIHNGKVALLTEKVLSDNLYFSRHEIETAIISLGFERVIFIPTEPEDKIGHADGIVKFLRPSLLLVNDYKGAAFRVYKQRLYATLKRAKLDVELIPFPWFCTNEKINGIWSAVGCYINFVVTSRGIIFPTFSHRMDERAAALLDDLTRLPKRCVESTALAKLGGVLNCATLTF